VLRPGPAPALDGQRELGDEPVGVRSGAVTAYTFHPELTNDTSIHKEFIK